MPERGVVIEANRLLAVLQGTMSLEGQGLDKATLRRLKRRILARLLCGPLAQPAPAVPAHTEPGD